MEETSTLESPKTPTKNSPSTFKPFIDLEFRSGNLLIKTASTVKELVGALNLRSHIFQSEYGVAADQTVWDVDDLDSVCDHLIIIDQNTHKVIATTRLIASCFSKNFYSQTEFVLGSFLAEPGAKLEMGRVCIDPSARNGVPMSLLWKAVARYANAIKAQWLFGCASVRTENPLEAAALGLYFQKNGFSLSHWPIFPLHKYFMPELPDALESMKEMQAPSHDWYLERIPSLIQMYLKAGAKIVPQPAHDKEFHCLDFLTILNFNELSHRFTRRYQNDG